VFWSAPEFLSGEFPVLFFLFWFFLFFRFHFALGVRFVVVVMRRWFCFLEFWLFPAVYSFSGRFPARSSYLFFCSVFCSVFCFWSRFLFFVFFAFCCLSGAGGGSGSLVWFLELRRCVRCDSVLGLFWIWRYWTVSELWWWFGVVWSTVTAYLLVLAVVMAGWGVEVVISDLDV
jgi:hypothetical protein